VACSVPGMDPGPQIASLSPAIAAASAGQGEEGSATPAAEGAAGFPAAMADAAGDTARTSPSGDDIREQNGTGGTPVPDSGNLLPLLAGLPLPVTVAAATTSLPPATPPSTTVPVAARPASASTLRSTSPGRAHSVPDGRAEQPGRQATPFPELLASGGGPDAVARSVWPADASGDVDRGAGSAGPLFAGVRGATGQPSQTETTSPSIEGPAIDALPAGKADTIDADPEPPMRPVVSTDRPVLQVAQDADTQFRADTSPSPSVDTFRDPATLQVSGELRPDETSGRSAAADTGTTERTSSGAPPVAAAAAATDAPRPVDRPVVMQLATSVANPGWADGLADRVNWMVQQDLGQAHLRLNPPQLGPVEVRVQVSGEQATVAFTAHNQQARDALENASQRLRDLLGSQGFVNVQVDINQQAFHERPMLTQPYDEGMPQARPDGVPTAITTVVRGARGLLDAYA